MSSTSERSRIAVIGAALDLGSGRRGVDMGPSAIRYGGLEERLGALGLDRYDRGNVGAPTVERLDQGDSVHALLGFHQADL